MPTYTGLDGSGNPLHFETSTNSNDGSSAPNALTNRAVLALEDLSEISSSNPCPVVPNQPTEIFTGQGTVVTAGTKIQLPSQAISSTCTIRAMSGNTGEIYVITAGGTGSSDGFPLDPGESSPPIEVSNLNTIRIDAATNGDRFAYLAS